MAFGPLSKLFGGKPKIRTRRFDAAGGGRRWDARPSFGHVGSETLAASHSIRSRSRYFANNNAYASSAVSALTAAIIGTGIVPTSTHPETGQREAIGAAFGQWAIQADADGLTDFWGIQAAAVAAMVTDGESFVQLLTTPDGLRLRLIPSEMVDVAHSAELGGGARIIGGIEFDAQGRRVAYWVIPVRPTDLNVTYAPPVRIPADQILHLYRPLGAGQVRGVSWFAPVLLRLSELDQLEDALLVGAKTAAMFSGFLYDQNGTGAGENPFEGVTSGSILESGLEPGTLKYLPTGWDIKFSTPGEGHQSVEFAAHALRAIAAGLGLPEHLISGDLRNANYSSLRAGLVAFRQRVEQIQFQTVIPQLVRPVWGRAVATLVLSGDLAGPGFEARSAEFLAAEFIPPAQPWVDPMKDAQAEALMVESGFKSRRQVVASLGYSIEAVDAEIAADREREESLGLSFGAPPASDNSEESDEAPNAANP